MASSAYAGFGSTEVFLPAVGRAPGVGGAQIYTTVWATNLTGAPETFTFHFLKQGQSNAVAASPITRSQNPPYGDLASASAQLSAATSFTDTLAPGETKVYENIVETKLGLSGVIGAARIVSSGEIFVAERIFNQSPGDDLGRTEGMFFTGVPRGFSISTGQSASVQAVDQGGSENFRTNFVLVETGGGSPTVNVQVFDGSGHLQGQKAYPLLPYEQILPNISDVVPGIATANSRITATVTGGTGSAILALAQIANESQDPSGAEMTFRDSLLGSGGTAGVTSLNALTGALTLKAGNGISITPSGTSIDISFTGGGSSGLTSVTHDASLAGAGTGASPLAIADGAVVRSINGLHDNLTIAAGSNVSITPSGSSLIVSSSPGGLTLPYSGSSSSTTTSFNVINSGAGIAILGESNASGSSPDQHPFAIFGFNTASGTGVYGSTNGTSGKQGVAGVWGDSANVTGVYGSSSGDAGVRGISASGEGVHGETASSVFAGVSAYNSGNGDGMYAESAGATGIYAIGYTGGYFVGKGGSAGIYADNQDHSQVVGSFNGSIGVKGSVYTFGVGAVKFDDPRDPSRQSLTHAFVGSSEMKNIYDGVATLDASGVSVVRLPEWFDALNRDFRYQLTALGTPQAGLFVSREIADNTFVIAGGVPGARVSWQVTGVRQDSWAQEHPMRVVETRSERESAFPPPPNVPGRATATGAEK